MILCIAGAQILSAVTVLALFYFGVESAMLDMSQRLLAQRHRAVADDISNFLEPAFETVNTVTRLIETGTIDLNDTSTVERNLFSFVRTHNFIMSAYFVKLDGDLVAVQRSDRMAEFESVRFDGSSDEISRIFRDDGFLPVARFVENGASVSDAMRVGWLEDFSPDEEVAWVNVNPHNSILPDAAGATFAGPVKMEGDIIGFLAVEINFDGLGDRLRGETLEWAQTSTIIDENGNVILQVGGGTVSAGLQVTQLEQAGDAITAMAYSDHQAQANPVYTARYSDPVEGVRRDYLVHVANLTSPGLDWVLSVHGPKDGVTGGLASHQRKLIWIGLCTVILLSFVALPIANQIRDPLLHFSNQSKRASSDKNAQINAPYKELATTGIALAEEIDKRRNYQAVYERTFELSSRGMARVDPVSFRFLGANKKMSELLGMDEAKLTALDLSHVIHEENENPLAGFTVAIMDDREFSVETKCLAAGGKIIWVRITAVLIRDHLGQPNHALVIFDDIQEARRTEAQLETLKLDLNHVDRVNLMGQFASGLAHELNQPLGAMAIDADTASMLLNQPEFDRDELSNIVSDIGDHAQRAGDIIRALRQMVQKDRHSTGVFGLRELLEQTRLIMQSEARVYGINIRINTENEITCFGNRSQLGQLFVNLIRNSIEAIGSSMIMPAIIEVDAHSSGGLVVIKVKDNGPGVPDHIKPFAQFESTRPGGLGLGLSICQSLVIANDGDIKHENVLPRGACFTINLPRFDPNPKTEEPPIG